MCISSDFCSSVCTAVKKAGVSVRKALFAFLFLLLVSVCAVSFADASYPLSACSGTVTINDSYIVLTRTNLSEHPDMIASLGTTKDAMEADWIVRGVQLQAWTKKMDACLEITVVQDDESRQFFDLERQTRQVRNDYLSLHKGNSKFTEQGWTIMKPAWKKQTLGGNFLKFEYKRTAGDRTIRGVARKTVRNGYTVLLDYQVYGQYPQERLPRGTDDSYLNRIANTVSFETVEPASLDTAASGSADAPVVSAIGSGLLNITVPPPEETNTDTFTIEGTATPGAHLIGVAMRYSSSEALRFTADASRAGNFKMKITLPEEGLWHITLNLEINNAIVGEENFNTTTYSKTVIPVKMDAEVPENISGDELILSGVTSKGVTIQCIVSNGTTTFDKTVTTNGTGKFRFKVPSAAEGVYDITLAFSKKNYSTKRLTYTALRSLSSEEKLVRTTSKSITASYAVLTKKLDTYIGQTMHFNAYIVSVNQNGEEWLITAALKGGKNGYSNFLIFNAQDDPGLTPDTKLKLYGTCIGAYLVQSEEGDVSYPSFDYLYSEE